MRGLGVGGGGDENGVSRPCSIDALEGLIVLGDDKHLVSAASAAYADEPVGEEGEVGPGDGSEDDSAVPGRCGEGCSVLERVCSPRGGRRRVAGRPPGEEEGEEEEEREEGEEVG